MNGNNVNFTPTAADVSASGSKFLTKKNVKEIG